MLRGRCLHCHHPINFINFINEVMTGFIVLLNFTPSGNGLTRTFFSLILLVIAQLDWKTMTIPTSLIIILFLIGILHLLINQQFNWSLGLLLIGSYLLTQGINHHFQRIGNGDIDIMFILMIENGPLVTSQIILIASSLALIQLLGSQKKIIPFVPYLFIANLILLNFR